MAKQTPSTRGVPVDDIALETFHFGTCPIRTFRRNGLTWFLAKDVCKALEIARHKAATAALAEDQRCAMATVSAAINATGVSALVRASGKPRARRFQRWVERNVLAGAPVCVPPVPAPAPSKKAAALGPRFRTYDDLSFTRRNAQGERIQWFVPPRVNSGHEHYGIGEIWFGEVVELAHHNPQHAYEAMRFAGPEMARYWNHGHPEGFFDRMARWALAAILTNAREPELPIDLPRLGFAPLHGMQTMLASAAAPRPLPQAVQQAIDRQAWREASECQRHYYECRRRDLMARHD